MSVSESMGGLWRTDCVVPVTVPASAALKSLFLFPLRVGLLTNWNRQGWKQMLWWLDMYCRLNFVSRDQPVQHTTTLQHKVVPLCCKMNDGFVLRILNHVAFMSCFVFCFHRRLWQISADPRRVPETAFCRVVALEHLVEHPGVQAAGAPHPHGLQRYF